MIAQGGRMRYVDGKLIINGVMDENHRDRMLRATADPAFIKAAQEFALRSQADKKTAGDTQAAADKDKSDAEKSTANAAFSTKWELTSPPAKFDPNYLRGYNPKDLEISVNGQPVTFTGDNDVPQGADTATITTHVELADRDYKQLLVAGANPEFRAALNTMYQDAAKYRVGSSWLLWFYILCTLGELCLSPVGLSMVSKLAPRRFATMLMGIWLLTSFFGNFTAGLAGENWEYLAPQTYFTYIAIALLGASAVCYVLVRVINRMMHGVR